MSAVQIAGSGAGKSAVAAVLARRGLVCVDADDDPLLARFVDAAGTVVTEEPTAPDLAWLGRHRWAWDPERLDELILAAMPATLYVSHSSRWSTRSSPARRRYRRGPSRAVFDGLPPKCR
jgi:hypothetical protein